MLKNKATLVKWLVLGSVAILAVANVAVAFADNIIYP